MIYFPHIPKAGGTTLKKKFYKAFGENNCLKVWNGFASNAEVADFHQISDLKQYSAIVGHLPVSIFLEKVTFDDLHTTSENGDVISRNIIHCMPIWGKSLHDEDGYFNEEKYGASADWAFWLECTKHDKTFCLVPELYSQYIYQRTIP